MPKTLPHALTSWVNRFIPGLSRLLRYKKSDFRHDFISGISVAAVCLPVGIAYAEIAGVPLANGIYSALLPLLVYALFGSSRQLITGPDATTCLMVALSIITGVLTILLGVLRFGFLANFLSHPILIGYLNGVALIILVGQLPKLFGYHGEAGKFGGKLIEFADNVSNTHLPTLLRGGTALLVLMGMKRWTPRLPGAFIVALLSIVVVKVLQLHLHGVAVFGEVPSGLPVFRLPHQ